MSVGLGLRAMLMRSLAAGMMVQSGAVTAQVLPEDQADKPAAPAGDIIVTGDAVDDRSTMPNRKLPVIDTPATVAVISDDLIDQQGRTTLRDTLRNITGISFQAGEGNPPGGGDAFSVRGFSARDDILVDGLRDIGNYFRDPFIAHRIDVTKGPASAFAGRGNVGGTVNILTHAPKLGDFVRAEATAGTANLWRGEIDANVALDYDNGIALRVQGLVHSADEPGRDVTRNRRWAVAPTLIFGLDGPTSVEIKLNHTQQRNIPDYGIPNVRDLSFAGSRFFGQPAPVRRSNFYGYSTDYYEVDATTATLRIDHEFADGIALLHQTRHGQVHVFSLASAPRWFDARARLPRQHRFSGAARLAIIATPPGSTRPR